MFSLTLPQINFILLSKCRLLLPTLQHSQRRSLCRRPSFRRCILERFFYFRPLISKPALPGGLFLYAHQFIDRFSKDFRYYLPPPTSRRSSSFHPITHVSSRGTNLFCKFFLRHSLTVNLFKKFWASAFLWDIFHIFALLFVHNANFSVFRVCDIEVSCFSS